MRSSSTRHRAKEPLWPGPRVEDRCTQFTVPIVGVNTAKDKRESAQRTADKTKTLLNSLLNCRIFPLKNSHLSPLIQGLPPFIATALLCEKAFARSEHRKWSQLSNGPFTAMPAHPTWLWPQDPFCPRLLTDYLWIYSPNCREWRVTLKCQD